MNPQPPWPERPPTAAQRKALALARLDASRTLTRTVRQFGQAPQSFIFGPPRVAPGPGEPGFAGFGSAAP